MYESVQVQMKKVRKMTVSDQTLSQITFSPYEKGATLVEILISTAVFSIIALTAVTLLIEFQTSYSSLKEKIKTSENLTLIGSALKTELSQAVELQQSTSPSLPLSTYSPIQSLQVNRSQITPFDANALWTNTTGSGRVFCARRIHSVETYVRVSASN